MAELVGTIILPDNGRLDYDQNGSEDVLGTFAVLPIRVPKMVEAWTDRDSGKPVAMWADGARIHPRDFATVWHGVEHYNTDLLKRGVVSAPPAAAITADGPGSALDPGFVVNFTDWVRDFTDWANIAFFTDISEGKTPTNSSA